MGEGVPVGGAEGEGINRGAPAMSPLSSRPSFHLF